MRASTPTRRPPSNGTSARDAAMMTCCAYPEGSPELIGHSGANGAMACYSPERDLYVVGTLDQFDAPARPFSRMLKAVAAA